MYIEERHQAILDWLAEKGLLKRTHGEALPLRQIAIGRHAKMTMKDMTSVKENYMEIAKKR